MNAGTSVTVLKLDLDEHVVWQYRARVVAHGANQVILEARFDREDFRFLDLVLKKGDRFVETYYDDRGYNIFAIFDRDSGGFKGWYCNLSRPARITPSHVAWVDLALDLWVWPDGRRAVLDREEFEELPLQSSERADVERTLLELERAFEYRRPPT